MGDDKTPLGVNDIDGCSRQGGNNTGPGARGIDDLLCFNDEFFTGDNILQMRSLDFMVAFFKPHHLGKAQQCAAQLLGLGHIFHR